MATPLLLLLLISVQYPTFGLGCSWGTTGRYPTQIPFHFNGTLTDWRSNNCGKNPFNSLARSQFEFSCYWLELTITEDLYNFTVCSFCVEFVNRTKPCVEAGLDLIWEEDNFSFQVHHNPARNATTLHVQGCFQINMGSADSTGFLQAIGYDNDVQSRGRECRPVYEFLMKRKPVISLDRRRIRVIGCLIGLVVAGIMLVVCLEVAKLNRQMGSN